MGCWGYKLYQDDLAQDVRDAYVDLLHRGKTDNEAVGEILARYRELDEDEDPGEYALLWKRFESYTIRNLSNWDIQ